MSPKQSNTITIDHVSLSHINFIVIEISPMAPIREAADHGVTEVLAGTVFIHDPTADGYYEYALDAPQVYATMRTILAGVSGSKDQPLGNIICLRINKIFQLLDILTELSPIVGGRDLLKEVVDMKYEDEHKIVYVKLQAAQ